MKVEIDGKAYCVETLIFDNKRLREEVVASAELHRLILDKIRAEIDTYLEIEGFGSEYRNDVKKIIDKYKAESEDKE